MCSGNLGFRIDIWRHIYLEKVREIMEEEFLRAMRKEVIRLFKHWYWVLREGER